MEIIASIVTALVISVICNRIMVVHTFKVIDDHTSRLCEMTKKLIRDTYSGKGTP